MILQSLKILGLSLLCTNLLSCGASKVPNSSSLSSRVAPVPGGSVGTGGTLTYYAECNKAVSNNGLATTVYLSTYYDYYGQYISDKINFKFAQVPNDLMRDGDLYFQIYPWRIDSNGSRQVSNVPLSFYFIQRGTGTINTPQPINYISLDQVNNVISSNNLSNRGIDANNFFTHHNLILLNVDLQFDAILMVLYRKKSEGNSDVVGTADALIPAFYANPNSYKEKNPYPDLYNLHPLKAYAGSYSNDKEYQNLADQICQGFLTALQRMKVTHTRAIASAEDSSCEGSEGVRCINNIQNGDGNLSWWQKFIFNVKSFFQKLF